DASHGVSAAVRDLPIADLAAPGSEHEHDRPRRFSHPGDGLSIVGVHTDPVAQTQVTESFSGTNGADFIGLGVSGSYTPDAAPPDTKGAIGGPTYTLSSGATHSSQYVQWVNEDFAVFNTNPNRADHKPVGAILAGPTAGNNLFASLAGNPCA